MSTFVLYGEPGRGSALAEAQLVWYGLEHLICVLTDADKML